MRIVYVTQRLPFGTGETFIVPEIEALLAQGHEVMIVPRSSEGGIVHDDVEALAARTRVLPGGGTVAAAVTGAALRRPRRVLSAFRPLLRTRPRRRALANLVAAAQGIWLAGVAREWGADHIHAHWAHLPATLAMAASVASGLPWSFTAHRYDVVLNNLLDEKLRSARFGRFIARQMLALAETLVAPEAAGRALVLHVGVALPPAPPAAVPERARPVVLCPATMVAVKGHRYLLEAAARLAARGVEFELWLAGDGPEADAIGAHIGRLALGDRVRRHGLVPHATLLGWYRDRRVDCVVLPSLDLGGGLHEGISVALVEAMAHGIPAIGTATGGLPELLEGGAGLLVPAADPDALAEAVERVLSSADLRAEVGRAGRRRVEEAFDAATIARQLALRFA